MMNKEKKDLPMEKKTFTDTVGGAFTSVGSGVKKSVSGTMDWIRNFFFKIWGMLLLTMLAIGALIVLLAFAVSILDGTTSFKRLCGNQSIVSCLSLAKDAPVVLESTKDLLDQSSPKERSLTTDQVSDKDLLIEEKIVEPETSAEEK